jgi:hypothetical protein
MAQVIVMRATLLLGLLALLCTGCDQHTSKLRELRWGRPFDADYAVLLERTRYVLLRQFQLGFDPDLTKEKDGVFWTVWHYRMATNYRDSKRIKAHVEVEDLGDGKARIGVSVVTQLNDNIDNPSVKEEARWVGTERDEEWAARIEASIARRYLDVEGSKQWQERHRPKRRGTMRQDILDRNKDVDLEEQEKDDKKREFPPSTGDG